MSEARPQPGQPDPGADRARSRRAATSSSAPCTSAAAIARPPAARTVPRSHRRSGAPQPCTRTSPRAASSSRPSAPKPHCSLTEAPSSWGSRQQEAGRLQARTPGALQLKYLRGAGGGRQCAGRGPGLGTPRCTGHLLPPPHLSRATHRPECTHMRHTGVSPHRHTCTRAQAHNCAHRHRQHTPWQENILN